MFPRMSFLRKWEKDELAAVLCLQPAEFPAHFEPRPVAKSSPTFRDTQESPLPQPYFFAL